MYSREPKVVDEIKRSLRGSKRRTTLMERNSCEMKTLMRHLLFSSTSVFSLFLCNGEDDHDRNVCMYVANCNVSKHLLVTKNYKAFIKKYNISCFPNYLTEKRI